MLLSKVWYELQYVCGINLLHQSNRLQLTWNNSRFSFVTYISQWWHTVFLVTRQNYRYVKRKCWCSWWFFVRSAGAPDGFLHKVLVLLMVFCMKCWCSWWFLYQVLVLLKVLVHLTVFFCIVYRDQTPETMTWHYMLTTVCGLHATVGPVVGAQENKHNTATVHRHTEWHHPANTKMIKELNIQEAFPRWVQ